MILFLISGLLSYFKWLGLTVDILPLFGSSITIYLEGENCWFYCLQPALATSCLFGIIVIKKYIKIFDALLNFDYSSSKEPWLFLSLYFRWICSLVHFFGNLLCSYYKNYTNILKLCFKMTKNKYSIIGSLDN